MANEVEIILKATDQASATIKGMGANVKGSFTEINNAIGLTKEAFGAVQNVMDQTVGYTMSLAKQVRTLKTEIGATPQEASKLIEVAGDMEISFESLETALKGAIRKGYEPTIENIGKLSDAYLELAPGVERTKFLMDTFGRSGADLARLMELGSKEIRAMGDSLDNTAKVMSEQDLKAAEEYRMSLENLNDQVEIIKLSIGKGLIPVLANFGSSVSTAISLSDALDEAVKSGALSTEQATRTDIKRADAVDVLNKAIRDHNQEIEKFKTMTDTATAATNGATAATDGLTTSTVAYTDADRELQKLYADDVQARNDATAAINLQANTFTSASDAISKYSKELLYNKATQDLDYASALEVGRALGLVDEAAITASEKLAILRKAYEDGKLSAADYARAVANLNKTIQDMKDKQVFLDVTTRFHNTGGGGGAATDKWWEKNKASGGPVMANTAYIVGEAGPELFVPSMPGNIIPNNQINNSRTVNINVSPHYYKGSEPSLMDELALIGAFSRA